MKSYKYLVTKCGTLFAYLIIIFDTNFQAFSYRTMTLDHNKKLKKEDK